MMAQETLFRQITDYANRANPYPFYAQLRQTPVSRQADGTYVVSTYREIVELLHDPRISSDFRNRTQTAGEPDTTIHRGNLPPSFITIDPPEHDRLRRLAMRGFGPPHSPERVFAMQGELKQIANTLIDKMKGKQQIDIVDDFAYPLPVTVICKLLGVPQQDEPRFHVWADALVNSIDPGNQADVDEVRQRGTQAFEALSRYMAELIEVHSKKPGNDLLSEMVTDDGPDGRMPLGDLVSTAVLLLIAGHETTVNLITNGMLTLLRYPDILARLRKGPELVLPLVEELLRYEPPVHFLPQRTALTDVTIAGTTIPKGAPLVLMLASGSRDPNHYIDPDRFDPDRKENQHLGFGGGIHNCFGAPLARLEVQIALTTLVSRLEQPRLVVDPPPYRQSPVLRGPRHLLVEIEQIGNSVTM
jgi:cytochrome P450